MPGDEYAPIVRGGLKLKGSKPAGISKKKKKSKPKESEGEKSAPQKVLEDEDASASRDNGVAKDGDGGDDGNVMSEAQLREFESRGYDGKTASERQYEEMRRKRLQDRLAREGVKTHKQRVEELNKYLSTLSEHHDMPRIGPG